MIFKKNKVYDVLKFITLRVLPPILAFAGIVLTQFNYSHTEMVMIIGTGFITMLGQILGISSAKYNKTELIEQYDQEEDNALEYEVEEDGEE